MLNRNFVRKSTVRDSIDLMHMTSQKGAPACWGVKWGTVTCAHRQAWSQLANPCMPHRRAGPGPRTDWEASSTTRAHSATSLDPQHGVVVYGDVTSMHKVYWGSRIQDQSSSRHFLVLVLSFVQSLRDFHRPYALMSSRRHVGGRCHCLVRACDLLLAHRWQLRLHIILYPPSEGTMRFITSICIWSICMSGLDLGISALDPNTGMGGHTHTLIITLPCSYKVI